MKQRKPWEIHEELTEERINELGRLIYKTRWDNLANEDDRDNAWSLGCRAYAWCASEISTLSASSDYEWLEIIDPSLRFIFSIQGINVSFYKGDPNTPKKNIYNRAQAFPELRQSELFIEEPSLSSNLVWTYAVEIDFDGHTTNISFQGITEDDVIIATHLVPLDEVELDFIPIRPIIRTEHRDEAVDVESIKPKLKVTKPDEDQKENKDE